MGGDRRPVDRTQRDFLAAWGRGDAGPVPCGACTACCHYPGVVVDEKRDRKRLAHLRVNSGNYQPLKGRQQPGRRVSSSLCPGPVARSILIAARAALPTSRQTASALRSAAFSACSASAAAL
jgi:hypothetical protein